MIELHYAEGKDLGQEIIKINLNNTKELKRFLEGVRNKDDEQTVYLFTSNHYLDIDDEYNEYLREIYIESDTVLLSSQILKVLDYTDTICYLQEYASFEDAYKVALDMRECNALCYNKN